MTYFAAPSLRRLSLLSKNRTSEKKKMRLCERVSDKHHDRYTKDNAACHSLYQGNKVNMVN